MKVILINGKAESGKDFVAAKLEKLLGSQGKTILTIHFGDLVKFVCERYYGWDGKKDQAGRHLLQYVGTDMRLGFDQSLWAELTGRLIRFLGRGCDYVLVPDWRFRIEHGVMRQMFGDDLVTMRVQRWADQEYTQPYQNHLTPQQRCHPSECELDGVAADYTIDNCPSLEYNDNILQEQLESMVKEIERG